MAANRYEAYYLRQAGSGIAPAYAGARHQKGYGIGGFLKGLLRAVFPVVKAAGSQLLGEAAKAGLNVLTDVSAGQAPLKESFVRHMTHAGENLKRKAASELGGGGGIAYKRKRKAPLSQSRRTARAVQTRSSNRGVLLKSDIFGSAK